MIYAKCEINKAGDCLRAPEIYSKEEHEKAQTVLTYFRTIHGPVLNAFQALLRTDLKTKQINGFVAQRLKRTPSIIAKLLRENTMQLARMQDIAGIRVVIATIPLLTRFHTDLLSKRFKHTALPEKDYINNPKTSGYRGIHKVYIYNSNEFPESHGLRIEVQIRTKLQHAWATAVETMSTFIGYSLKSSDGPELILDFFKLVSSAFAYIEGTCLIPGYTHLTKDETFDKVIGEYSRLNISEKLRGFTVAADHIKKQTSKGQYYLITLDLKEKRVRIKRFLKTELGKANEAYTAAEKDIESTGTGQAVLVSIDKIDSLKKAYPNYFLDTRDFIEKIESIEKKQKQKSFVK